MSWRRGLRHCLPSGFPGSCRLFTILEDRARYTPLVPPGKVAVAGLVLDAVYNAGPDDAPRMRKAEVQGTKRACLRRVSAGYQLASGMEKQERIASLRLRMMIPRLFVRASDLIMI